MKNKKYQKFSSKGVEPPLKRKHYYIEQHILRDSAIWEKRTSIQSILKCTFDLIARTF